MSAPTYGASSDGATHQGLAGGNFYWVSTAGGHDDAKGHNVLGVSGQDAILGYAPGGGGCSISCHASLAIVPGDDYMHMNAYDKKNGCEGCHVFTKHHVDEGVYRFLYNHWDPGGNTETVRGQGDPIWEYNPTASTHNTYIGTQNVFADMKDGSISVYCARCHNSFFREGAYDWPDMPAGPWFRHPNDIVIPSEGEYVAYAIYNPIVPVARPEGNFPSDPSQVRPGTDMVMCITCHRAHGSPYFKMLRWDYKGWPGNVQTNGCIICHSSRD